MHFHSGVYIHICEEPGFALVVSPAWAHVSRISWDPEVDALPNMGSPKEA